MTNHDKYHKSKRIPPCNRTLFPLHNSYLHSPKVIVFWYCTSVSYCMIILEGVPYEQTQKKTPNIITHFLYQHAFALLVLGGI